MNHELQSKRVLIVEDSESKISMSMNSAIMKLMDELAAKEIESERLFSGEGSERLKYIFAAFVVPKSRLEPLFCTLLKAS